MWHKAPTGRVTSGTLISPNDLTSGSTGSGVIATDITDLGAAVIGEVTTVCATREDGVMGVLTG